MKASQLAIMHSRRPSGLHMFYFRMRHETICRTPARAARKFPANTAPAVVHLHNSSCPRPSWSTGHGDKGDGSLARAVAMLPQYYCAQLQHRQRQRAGAGHSRDIAEDA